MKSRGQRRPLAGREAVKLRELSKQRRIELERRGASYQVRGYWRVRGAG